MNYENIGVTMSSLNEISLIIFALVIGMRHGIDWDHIAAISDITSTQTEKKSGIILSLLYAVGHASVITALALSALLIGITLPNSVDTLMEKIVGLTLLALGFYVIYALNKHGDHLRLLPRWALIFYGILRVFDWINAKITGKPVKDRKLLMNYGNASAFTIGVIHGIGAETPTQIYIFAISLTAGISSIWSSAQIIMAFVAGIVLTNTIMGVMGAYGYVSAGRSVYKYLAVFTAIFSIIIGLIFIAGAELPDLTTLFQWKGISLSV